MSKRPPLLGYNHNVRHAGRLFHVQTEDSGPARPVITTHLFIEGTILSSQRTPYSLDEPESVTQKRMQEQHKAMLKKLRDGLFDNLPEVQRFPVHKAHPTAETDAATHKAGVPKTESGSSPILSPVPPPPVPPSVNTGTLADRLKKLSGGTVPAVATGDPKTAVLQQENKVIVAQDLSAEEAVVEFEAGMDEDEPAVTFEAEADDDALSETTPLPKAAPMAALEPEESTAQFGAHQMPIVSPPQTRPASILASIPPVQRSIPTYTIPPDLFRPRPTAEGVTLRRSPPVPVSRPPTDPIRTTIIRGRPTRPAPLVPALKPGQTLPPDSSLDADLLSYLNRVSKS